LNTASHQKTAGREGLEPT